MIKPNSVFFICVLLLICSKSIGAETNSAICTQGDYEYAEFRDNYYGPADAYEFGLVIQGLVRNRDLDGLLALAPEELTNGPRKAYANDKNFRDVFSEAWRTNILEEPPPCSPVGWRGFMLSSGEVWYDKTEGEWQLISLNGAIEEKYDTGNLAVEWRISGKTFPPQCFIREWLSSDNYKEYESKYAISNTEDFRKRPGRYLGKEIPTLTPIIPSWSSDGETLSLVMEVVACYAKNYETTVVGRTVESKDCDKDGNCTEYAYEMLETLSTQQCKQLAPHIPGHCISKRQASTITVT